MNANEIREKFLKYFEGKGHKIVKSDLLVPQNDPTLLFTGAGMNQFKEQFVGKNVTFKRAVSSQKCIRTGDIENVGKTPRHHTFFEMLGNFSFGDYFKKEAISWAWDFMTVQMNIPEEKLWISVYTEDDEAYDIWKNDVGIPEKRIVKLGPSDNFWPADAPSKGPNGPCGPCSEIFYDWGKEKGCGKDCDPSCDCGRFVEIWNLVFTEFDRQPDGSLKPLPNKNIDTGMGLERIVAVKQGVYTNFDTDLFVPIISEIRKVFDAKDLISHEYNLMADHIRAVSFAVCDGVSPSNEKRGYVIRKLIRRAWLKGSKLKAPFLYNMVPLIAKLFEDVYPELQEKAEHIAAIVKEEEKRFQETLDTAVPIMKEMVRAGDNNLSGKNIFKLVDTYGLPFELIAEVYSKEWDFKIETDEYEKLMEERKELSRKGSDIAKDFIFKLDDFNDAPKPEYSSDMPLSARIEFILKDEVPGEEIKEGANAEIIISPQSSLLYGESGGQSGDTGIISSGENIMHLMNTVEADGRKILEVHVEKGVFSKGTNVKLEMDTTRKDNTASNHTATHLLQSALRTVLGEQVKQSGSYVDDQRLRFDFTYLKKMSEREIVKVESLVNGWIKENIPVCKETKSIEEAKTEGALSFFGEKYGERVRVVSVGEKSKELCGGTHVDNSLDIGLFKIVAESSIASGVRRIEAVTGKTAKNWIKEKITENLQFLKGNEDKIEKNALLISKDIAAGTLEIDERVIYEYEIKIKHAFSEAKEKIEKAAKKQQKEEALNAFGSIQPVLDKIVTGPEEIGEIRYFSGVLEKLNISLLKKAAFYVGKKIGSGIVLLGSGEASKAYITCVVSEDLSAKGFDASEIIKAVSSKIGGSGGGKNTFAQAGGKNPEGLKEAIEKGKSYIEKRG